jgi:hypothetical protein
VVALVVFPMMAWRFKDSSTSAPVVAALAAYAIVPLAMLPMFRARVRSVEEDLQELDFQIDLQQFDAALAKAARKRFFA